MPLTIDSLMLSWNSIYSLIFKGSELNERLMNIRDDLLVRQLLTFTKRPYVGWKLLMQQAKDDQYRKVNMGHYQPLNYKPVSPSYYLKTAFSNAIMTAYMPLMKITNGKNRRKV